MSKSRRETALTARDAPGFSDEDYRAAGIAVSTARMFRRYWVPPVLAATLRTRTSWRLDFTEQILRLLPARTLAAAVRVPGWLDARLYVVHLFAQDPVAFSAWAEQSVFNVSVCYDLHSKFGVSPLGAALFEADMAVPGDVLLDRADRARKLGGGPVDEWMLLARQSGRGPAPDWVDPLDPTVLGGRSGLYLAAGVSVEEARQWEHQGIGADRDRLAGVVASAALRGHDLPEAEFWADRSRSSRS